MDAVYTTQGLASIMQERGRDTREQDAYDRLCESLMNTPAPPCIADNCPLYKTCAAKQLACADFYRYVNSEQLTGDREPTRRLYDRIYKGAVHEDQEGVLPSARLV